MRLFDSGATRDDGDGKIDPEGFFSPAVLRDYCHYMHANRVQSDGKLRDSDNWQKGIPKEQYMKSAWRHFLEWWEAHRSGEDTREACNALLFNVMGYRFECLREPGPPAPLAELQRLAGVPRRNAMPGPRVICSICSGDGGFVSGIAGNDWRRCHHCEGTGNAA